MARTIANQPGPCREADLSLRLSPIVVSAIWAVTALPVDVSSFAAEGRLWRAGFYDFVGNVVLYVPLGIVLHRSPWWRVLLLAAGVSIAAEFSQLWYPDRFTAANDVVANVGGAVLGYLFALFAARFLGRDLDLVGASRRVAALSSLVFVAIVFALTQPGSPAGFSNWDPGCRLIAGDELTRNRPWRGEIYETAVFNRAFGKSDIERLSVAGARGNLSAVLDSLSPVFALVPSAPLDSIRGVPLLGAAAHERLYRALAETGRITVVSRFRTRSEKQSGPARIFGFSRSPWNQNFSLGQEGRDVVFRLRTPTTLPGGFYPETRARRVLGEGRDAVVVAAYDGRNVRLYVDGAPRARLNLSARGKASRTLADTGLPAVAFLLGGLSSVVWVVAAGASGTRPRVVWGAVGGGLGAAAFVLAGGAEALPEFARWVPLVGAWGGAVVGASAARPPGFALQHGAKEGPY